MRRINIVSIIMANMVLLIPFSNTSWSEAVLDDYAADVTTVGSVAVGAFVTGNIEHAQDIDWIGVTLYAHTTYSITMTSETLAMINVSLIKPDKAGVMHAQTSGSDESPPLETVLFYTPTITDYYHLVASAGNSSVGAYKLSVVVEGESVTPASTSQQESAPLEAENGVKKDPWVYIPMIMEKPFPKSFTKPRKSVVVVCPYFPCVLPSSDDYDYDYLRPLPRLRQH